MIRTGIGGKVEHMTAHLLVNLAFARAYPR